MFRTFSTEWRVKWVPAITGYCRRLKRKEITALFTGIEPDHLGT